MSRVPPPSPTYIGPPKHHGPPTNRPIKHVVIHSTVSPCEEGGARRIANYFKNPSYPSSAHYMVDPGEIIQGLYDSYIGYAAPPNEHKIHVEMCDMPGPRPKGTKEYIKSMRSKWRWNKSNQKRMLERTAWLTARICLAEDIPIQFVSSRGLRAGKQGITTHNNISKAFGQTSHWDPGWWPRRKFMRRVKANARIIRKHYMKR